MTANVTTDLTAPIHHVTVAGGGVLGSQIAMQIAFFGFQVTLFERDIDGAKKRIDKLVPVYAQHFNKDLADTQRIADAIVYQTDLAMAVKDAQILVEALPEVLDLKREFYQDLDKVAPSELILASNSSTLIPSQIVDATGRPEKFLALHFANRIWMHNTAEIMGTPATDPAVFDTVVEFAKNIGMVALPLYKEQSGYILNSMLVPFLTSGLALYAKDIAEPHTIDKTWMIATGSPMGPFGFMDIIGINTLLNVNQQQAKAGSQTAQLIADRLRQDFVDQGRMGVQSGKGFYDYPNPAYQSAEFLTNEPVEPFTK
ncbi:MULTISPECIES: 3-hydroxyacyl-CoA dehydrogenase [unclassified Moraxella]|uniref:3-hydroxyacyl-CoA dehydrogenase n=1 Tax=unclassified Moraxella TaxID=2685852 RepID=UPI003AF41950